MRKILPIMQMLLVICYAFAVMTQAFFPESSLNTELSTRMFFAQFYAFPLLFGGITAVFSLIAVAFGLLIHKRAGLTHTSFKFWSAVFIFSVIFATCGSDFTKSAGQPSDEINSIKIVEWNALNSLNEKQALKIFGEFDADIAVFPELGGNYKGDISNDRFREVFEKAGIDFTKYEVFSSPEMMGNIAPVTVIVKKENSDYEVVEENAMTTFGTVFLKSKIRDKPDIVGLHTAPPLPGLMDRWRWDLDLISSEIFKKYSNAIIVGDFNATTRHGLLGKPMTHEDSLSYAPKFTRGTWPVSLPSYFRTTIDHVFIPKGKYTVKDVEVVSFEESDHALVYVEICEWK